MKAVVLAALLVTIALLNPPVGVGCSLIFMGVMHKHWWHVVNRKETQ